MSNKFSIVTPVYNCENTIEQTIMSIAAQSYDNWRIIFLDDLSTDNSVEVIKNICKKLEISDKVDVVVNKTKHGEVANTLKAVDMCDPNDIICRIDGGDWVTDLDAFAIINSVYEQHDPAVLWTAHRWEYTTQNISGPLPDGADEYVHPWVSSHMKTFRCNAIQGINEANFKDDDGNFIMIACDQAVFLPILHRARKFNRKRLFLPLCCYHYSINLKDPNLFKSDRSIKQKHSAEFIRKRGYID